MSCLDTVTAFLKTIPSWKHSLTASLSDFPGLVFRAQHPTKHSFLPLREVRNSLPPGAPVPRPARGDPAATRPPTSPGAPGTGLRRVRSPRGRAVPGGALQAASLGAGTLPSCAPLPRTRTRRSRSCSPTPPPACAPSALTRPRARALPVAPAPRRPPRSCLPRRARPAPASSAAQLTCRGVSRPPAAKPAGFQNPRARRSHTVGSWLTRSQKISDSRRTVSPLG